MKNEPLDAWFIVKVRKLNERIQEIAEDVAWEGEKFVVDAIETRGTGKAWKRTYYKNGVGRSGSTPGRVWTGSMVGDVRSQVKGSNDAIVASFGWIKNFEEYYGMQDVGFTQANTGIEIEGMMAMADAKDYIAKYVKERMNRAAREF